MLKYQGRELVGGNGNKSNVKEIATEEGKMYGLYLVENGEVSEIDFNKEFKKCGSLFDNWYDHCVNPKFVNDLFINHGYYCSKEVFRKVVEEFNCNYLNIADNTQTSYYGNRVYITAKGGKYYVDYINPYTNESITHMFDNLSILNIWLDRIGSPSYKNLGKYL